MRLAEFIRSNLESLLQQWEEFAATLLPAAQGMGALALRDHAAQMLEAVAADLGTSQSRQQQALKSRGLATVVPGASETAAQVHAVLRARCGFDINQLVAEYRALRASVLRAWIDDGPETGTEMEDMIRFNEAIDQAIAESVGHFHGQVERNRNLMLGMLGHDMRSPLATIRTTASHLAALNAGSEVSMAAARIVRSGASMQALLDDLVDFNRTRLGLGIKIATSELDLSACMIDEVEQFRGAHPGRQIALAINGDCRGRWDERRLQQSLRNLLSNAIRYGAPDAPVQIELTGEPESVRLEVRNRGALPESVELRELFDPLKRGPAEEYANDRASLGLGLFIVQEVARAHGGEVEVQSSAGDTTFAMRLPRVS